MNDRWERELLSDLDAIRSGWLKTISHDQMRAELGLTSMDEAIAHIAAHSRDLLDRLGDVGLEITDD